MICPFLDKEQISIRKLHIINDIVFLDKTPLCHPMLFYNTILHPGQYQMIDGVLTWYDGIMIF